MGESKTQASIFATEYQRESPYQWRPSIRQTPWAAIAALILVVICAVIAAVIISVSNNHIADWKIQPSVILGIVSGIANTALLYAFWQGVVLTWWRSALHGTTLEHLNRVWFCGTSFTSALLSMRHMNKIAVASLLTTIATIVVSPLLQKASHTELLYFVDNVEMTMQIATKLKDGYSGIAFPQMPGNTLLTSDYLYAIQGWYNGNPLYTQDMPGYFCEGACAGNVTGAGFVRSCSSSAELVDLTQIDDSGDVLGFSTSFARFEDNSGKAFLELKAQYISKVDPTCKASTYTTEVCSFYPATINYPVLYVNNTISLDPNISATEVSQYSSIGDLPTALFETPAGPLSGMNWFADTYLSANSSIIHGVDPHGTEIYIELPSGILATQFLDLNPADFPNPMPKCGFQWFSPTETILNAFQSVSFRAAYLAAEAADAQSFPAVQVQPLVVYHSSYVYLGVALFLLLIAHIAVSMTLYGFWQLGRKTSLSPLETAQALRAPLLVEGSKASNIDSLVSEVGTKAVKYGVFSVDESTDSVEIGPRHLLVRELGQSGKE